MFVEAGIFAAEKIAMHSPNTLCDGEASTDEKALAWRISTEIKRLDPADIVRNVMSVMHDMNAAAPEYKEG